MDYEEIEQADLETRRQEADTIVLDCRETWEFQDFNVGGLNIPPHEITEKIDLLKPYKQIIVVCSNGTRSSIVARLLTKKLPNARIVHLEEGIF